ncbi:MAG: C10 family peptidase, partial [Bacteroidales bacterium]|nr:C10 family peptidase [Bacteroidales bacterium]
AVNFYYEKVNQFIQPVNYSEIRIKDSFVKKVNNEVVFYAFDMENGGFVIISAEDAFVPVIGYSYKGFYPKVADGLTNYGSFIESYIDQISFIRTNNITADQEVSEAWEYLLTDDILQLLTVTDDKDVDPLVASMWNQDSPYNILCPAEPICPGGHVYAGCVATCMSQVMHYWRYPFQGEGQHSYYCSGYGTQTANFGETEYNWNGMQNNIDNNNPNPIAELQYHAGVSVNMMYNYQGTCASGAASDDVDNALRDYFRYDNAQYLQKSWYSTSQWITILQDELDLGRPLYYSGFTTSGSGHAFVCDGYQGTNFHFNFGWSGYGNGYYTIYNVNGFYLYQEAVRNFYPTEPDYPYYASGLTITTNTSGSFTDGSGPVEDYLNNTDASWLIDPQTSQDSITDITLYFTKFDLESNDFITVYDGETTGDSVLGTFTGSSLPPNITSSGNKILITFISGGSGTAPGFMVEFTSSYPTYCSGLTMLTEVTEDFSDGSGTFNYRNGSVCMWKIEPDYAGTITLYFTSFNTEEDYDKVMVYDGTSIITTLSGDEIPDPITATSGSMFITFNTNSTITAPGWEAYYEIDNVGIIENDIFENFAIFPNPANENLNLKFTINETQNIKMKLMKITGEVVYSKNLTDFDGDYQKTIDVSQYSKGIYILSLITEKGTVNKKIVVK